MRALIPGSPTSCVMGKSGGTPWEARACRDCALQIICRFAGADFSELAKQNAGVAQLAAQPPCKQKVAGSIPAVGTGLWDDFRHVSQP